MNEKYLEKEPNTFAYAMSGLHELEYPIEWHESFGFLDSSKMQELAACPRKFFYRYILGWVSDHKSIHLIFGEAIHLALEHLYKTALSSENLKDAFTLFLDKYREEFSEVEDESVAPKNPAYAYMALEGYIKKYQEIDNEYKILGTEIKDTFFIDPHDSSKTMTMKLDLIVEDKKGNIIVIDHKTGSRNSQMWIDSWTLSIQMNNYLLGAMSYYGDKVTKLIVNGIFFTKTQTGDANKGYQRAPILASKGRMLGHLSMINFYYQLYESFMRALANTDPKSPVLDTFPRNPNTCSSYAGCPYHSICTVVEQPLSLKDKTLSGFKKEYWMGGTDDKPKNVEVI